MAQALAGRVEIMRRAFTLVETMVVIGIIILVAGLTYPLFVSVKRTTNRTTCISNLRQIGIATALYREAAGGSDQGTPSQMGLPLDLGALGLSGSDSLKCRGNNPNGNGYYDNYPGPRNPNAAHEAWAKYVSLVHSQAIMLFDPNHQASYPRSRRWERWTVLGLRLDTSVTVRTHLGFPLTFGWWHDGKAS